MTRMERIDFSVSTLASFGGFESAVEISDLCAVRSSLGLNALPFLFLFSFLPPLLC